jgi:CRP-like cAMP-binding protein
MEDKLWYLKNSSLFEQLDAVEIATIESRARMQKFARKALVYLPSDHGDSVFLLTAGRVKLFHVTAEGKETVLAFIEPGELFGELSLLMPGQQREEFAEAMAASTVVMIPGDEVRRLMEIKPLLTMQMTRLMGLRRQRLERRLKSLLFRSNRDRLVYLLLELAEKYGERSSEGLRLGIRLSHQELASVIGSTRETVTVLLGELQDERCLIIKRRQVILTNLDQLVNSLDEVPPEIARLVAPIKTDADQS